MSKSSNAVLNKDFVKVPLLALGFEATTFQPMSSCRSCFNHTLLSFFYFKNLGLA